MADNNTKDSVINPEAKAIELRYQGVKTAEIARSIDIPEGTVRNWFMKNGKLYQNYKEYEEELNNEVKQEAITLARKNAANAVKVILKEMVNGDTSASRVKASIELLKMSLPEMQALIQQQTNIQINQVIPILGGNAVQGDNSNAEVTEAQ